MFKIKNLTVKNFMSVGNSTQAVNFDRKDLTLVLGENIDLGGDDKDGIRDERFEDVFPEYKELRNFI